LANLLRVKGGGKEGPFLSLNYRGGGSSWDRYKLAKQKKCQPFDASAKRGEYRPPPKEGGGTKLFKRVALNRRSLVEGGKGEVGFCYAVNQEKTCRSGSRSKITKKAPFIDGRGALQEREDYFSEGGQGLPALRKNLLNEKE